MSFKPFDFTFNPPLTVPPAPLESISTSTESLNTARGKSSRVGQLITKLDELTATSKYLQDAILARTKNIAVQIDPSIDPNTGQALTHIYGSPIPDFISTKMYNNLLDAHLGVLQLEMATGKDSTIQPNPVQAADLITVTRAIDNHLIQSPSFNNWLPLQLVSLKGDAIVFQCWKDSLQKYPVYYSSQSLVPNSLRLSAIQAADLDISMGLYRYEDNVLNHFGQSYSTQYQMMAGVHAVERDINSVLNHYFYQPLGNIIRIISLFNALKGFAHKTSMSNIQADLVNYGMIRLASEVTGMLHSLDMLMAVGVAPLSGTLGPLGRIVAGAQAQAAEIGFLAGGGLSGLSKANACSQTNPYNKSNSSQSLSIPGMGAISEGLKYLAEHLNWASRETERNMGRLDKSFRQLLERRMKHQDDRNEIMCSLRALDTLIGVANGVAKEFQKGTVTQNPTQQQVQESSARILTSLQTGSATTFVSSGGEIIVNPPDMPEPPDPVRNVLRRAKVQSPKGPILTQ